MLKYFAPFSFDQIQSIFAISIKANLPFNFACIVCTLGIGFFNSQQSITSLFVSTKGAPGLLFLGTTIIGVAY